MQPARKFHMGMFTAPEGTTTKPQKGQPNNIRAYANFVNLFWLKMMGSFGQEIRQTKLLLCW